MEMKNRVRYAVFAFLVEVRDLPNSDCYRRSIACSRKGFTRHSRDAIFFVKIA